jgi:predicted nucleic acid-binding protein
LRIFLDSCVALAACLSQTGASRLIFELAAAQGWELVVSRWVLREMRENVDLIQNRRLFLFSVHRRQAPLKLLPKPYRRRALLMKSVSVSPSPKMEFRSIAAVA